LIIQCIIKLNENKIIFIVNNFLNLKTDENELNHILFIINYSETLEFNAYQIEIESNRIERTESNRNETKSIESNRTESKNRKNFLILKVLELREIFEINRIDLNSEYALNSRVSLYFCLSFKKLIFFQILKLIH